MIPKYRDRFEQLTDEQTATLNHALLRRYPEFPVSDDDLYSACAQSGLDQADVVMSMANTATLEGVVILEKVAGVPVTRGPTVVAKGAEVKQSRNVGRGKRTMSGENQALTRSEKKTRRRVSRPKTDPRIILAVVPNPKSPSSASYARFEQYEVGKRVDETVSSTDITSADIKWDSERGFITLGDA